MLLDRIVKSIFIALVFVTLLTPLILFRQLLYPFITGKAFFLRTVIELALPFYLYLIATGKNLRPHLKEPLTIAVLLFWLVTLVSAIFGKDFIRSFWGNFERMDSVFTSAHLVALYFYLLLLAKMSGAWLERLFKGLVWISAAAALNGIIGFLGGPTLTPDSSLPVRASSTFGNPIFFASFLVLPLTLSAFFALRAQNAKGKALYWAIFGLHLLGLTASGTRGVMVGLAGGIFFALVFYLIFASNRKVRWWGTGGLLIGAAFVLLLIVFAQKLPQSLNLRRLFTFKDSNTQARLIHWNMALNGFKESPILGTGPNNYYVISNKYYDTKIWQYDRSWFDKPHNYPLEILVTSGVFGLLAYLGIASIALWIIYRAFKLQILSLKEAALLAGGFLAYQIQNLFVFDTISASLAFYIVLGLLGYLWVETQADDRQKQKMVLNPTRIWPAKFALWTGLPVMLYLIFATNITGYKIARAVNLAKIFQTQDFDAGKILLDEATNSPFNFFLRDTAYEYSNFAAWYSNRNQPPEQLIKAKAMMDDAVAVAKKAAKAHPNDPTVWLKLGNALFAKSHLENAGFNQEAYDAGFKAHTLAPKKHDPKLFLAQVAIEGKRPQVAEKWLVEVLVDFSDLHDARWQLADIYYFSGRKEEAETLALEAVVAGFRLDKITKGDWLLTFYYETNQPQRSVDFLVVQARGNESNADYFARLADAYNKSGRFVEARAAALKVLELDPNSKAEVEAFLQSLPNQ